MAPRKYKIRPCPFCDSKNTVSRGEWVYNQLRRKCKDCGKSFLSIETKIKPIKVKKVKPIALPKTVKQVREPLCIQCLQSVCICDQLIKIEEQRAKMQLALSLDSVGSCPCFDCIGEKPNNCIESCQDLEDFLMGELQK